MEFAIVQSFTDKGLSPKATLEESRSSDPIRLTSSSPPIPMSHDYRNSSFLFNTILIYNQGVGSSILSAGTISYSATSKIPKTLSWTKPRVNLQKNARLCETYSAALKMLPVWSFQPKRTFIVAETLPYGSAIVEALGKILCVGMAISQQLPKCKSR